MSGHYLQTLGASVATGRAFGVNEDRPGAPVTAVISHRMWQRDFAGSATSSASRSSRVGFPPGGLPQWTHHRASLRMTYDYSERARLDGDLCRLLDPIGMLHAQEHRQGHDHRIDESQLQAHEWHEDVIDERSHNDAECYSDYKHVRASSLKKRYRPGH